MWETEKVTAKPGVVPVGNGGGNGVTVIGKSMVIKGRIESRQDIFVDGRVEGMLVAPESRVTIGPHGRAAAGANAREVEVQGSIDGNVESTEKVSVRTGGRLVGDVRTAGIVIEDGAYFKGTIDIVKRRAVAEVVAEAK